MDELIEEGVAMSADTALGEVAHRAHQRGASNEDEQSDDHAGPYGCMPCAVGMEHKGNTDRGCRHDQQKTNHEHREAVAHEVAADAELWRRSTPGKDSRGHAGVDRSEQQRCHNGGPGRPEISEDPEQDPPGGKEMPVPGRHVDFSDDLLEHIPRCRWGDQSVPRARNKRLPSPVKPRRR